MRFGSILYGFDSDIYIFIFVDFDFLFTILQAIESSYNFESFYYILLATFPAKKSSEYDELVYEDYASNAADYSKVC